MSKEQLHASAVLLGDRGVLIRGPSGSGKSSLVLALVAADPGRNALIGDDRIEVEAASGLLLAAVPEAIAGLIELRGHGIVRRPFHSPAVIDLAVDLVPSGGSPRLPERQDRQVTVAGVTLPRLLLPVDCADKPVRICTALQQGLEILP